MPSPNPYQHYPSPGYAEQTCQQPQLVPYPNQGYPQSYPQSSPYQGQSPFPPQGYFKSPTEHSLQPIAELPAAAPPAPPTSTPAQQLSEDERLAHQLAQMEVDNARKRASSSASYHQQQYQINMLTQPVPQYPPSQPYQQSSPTGPTSYSPTSPVPYGQQSYHQATHPQYSPHHSPQPPYLAPRPAPAPRPQSFHGIPSQPMIQIPQASPLMDPNSLSAYLETHRQVPYPPQWRLPPITSTFYGSFLYSPKTDWLDTLDSQFWRTIRFSDNGRNPAPPAFKLTFKSRGGNFRDPRLSWTMASSAGEKGKIQKSRTSWSYSLKRDLDSNRVKSEVIMTPKGKEIHCSYIHAKNYDSLSFRGVDGLLYKWVSHAPLDTLNGYRYDTLRHALFAGSQHGQDPLYGQIVADHAYWDGFVDLSEVHDGIECHGCSQKPVVGLRWKCKTCADHDVCEPCRLAGKSLMLDCKFTMVSLPDEALHIRNPRVDVGMAIATLQVLRDWELNTIREQRKQDPVGFELYLDNARKGDLGRIRHWRHTDFEGTGVKGGNATIGTLMKAINDANKAAEPRQTPGDIGSMLGGDGGGGGGGGGDGGSGGGGAC
ncbi:hypothetical protein K469DRAFT_714807 [Zopfia rhizophila CBS 207.26]|uniref:ZZ-type domain-containing protein n=1 Tax=Zopfia rhizophila CBS 207.26 TaxID=1314779 RepID=A0A6A6DLL1_9PEZI|nr:hypothetical protein K469DRAFT_714807 [Zopfia rhizophila CBS 207.26]